MAAGPSVLNAVKLCLWVTLIISVILTSNAVRIEYFYVAAGSTTIANCLVKCPAASPGRGAYPAVILTPAQNAIAFRAVPVDARAVIGGSRTTGDGTVFRWIAGPLGNESGGTGRPFFNGKLLDGGTCVSYCNWAPQQPDNDHGIENVIEFKYALDGGWNDSPDGYNKFTGCLCQRNALYSSLELTPSQNPTSDVSATKSAQTEQLSSSSSVQRTNSTTLSQSNTKYRTLSTTTTISKVSSTLSLTPSYSASGSSPSATFTGSRSMATKSTTATPSTVSPSTSRSQSPTARTSTHSSSFHNTTSVDIGTRTSTSSFSRSSTHSKDTATATETCGMPPIVTFLTAKSTTGALGGGATIAQISITDLLNQPAVVIWMSFSVDTPTMWVVTSRYALTGAAAGGAVNATQVTNTTLLPAFAAARLAASETLFRLTITPPAGGWDVTSTSQYVSQRFSVKVSVLCENGGTGDLFDYNLVVTAVGQQLPYSSVYSVTTTFGQSMAQIAAGTVVPTSLSTMRALARLASCGTTDSGSDTSYGVVSVLVPLVRPLSLSPDAEISALNILFCVIVGMFLVANAVCVYGFLCRCVPLADVLAHFHLPSLLTPSATFAFPTVLGSSVAILAQPNDDSSYSQSMALGVAAVGLGLSGVWMSWVWVATHVIGPRRVIAVRLPTRRTHTFPSLVDAAAVCRWVWRVLVSTNRSGYSWKGLSGEKSQRNIRWKHSYHILTQDVRFLLVPVAETLCTTVATVATSLVVVPGVGCQLAACLILFFYIGQTLLFLWLRPYTSIMMQVYSATTNTLTVAATMALAVNVFEWELLYSMQLSVAFQVMLLGMSTAKSMLDVVDFVEGSRRLWKWIMEQHVARMQATWQSTQLLVRYNEDDAVSDDDGMNVMMRSLAEDSPRTPMQLMKASVSAHSVFAVSQKPTPNDTSLPEPTAQRVDNSSFKLELTHEAHVDDIDKALRDRAALDAAGHRSRTIGDEHRQHAGFTVFLMDQSLDDFAEIAVKRPVSPDDAYHDNDDVDDDI